MLNELRDLAKTFGDFDMAANSWHREYKELPRVSKQTPCIRIWLAKDGMVTNIEELNDEQTRKIRKFGNKHMSFPAFNIEPLYRLTDNQRIEELENMVNGRALYDAAKIKSWCIEDDWRKSLCGKINNSLHKQPSKLLEIFQTQGIADQNAFTRLMEVARRFSENGTGSFRQSLEDKLFLNIDSNENIKTTLALLFNIKKSKKQTSKEQQRRSLSIVLDFDEWDLYDYPVANEKTTVWLNNILMNSEPAGNRELLAEANRHDAFGLSYTPVNQPMPSVNLPGLGEVKLRSMFRENRCQLRYRKIDDDSYPITIANRMEAKNALEKIKAPDKEGDFWLKAEAKEIFFAFPSHLPPDPVKFASVLGPPVGKERESAEALFECIAHNFIKTLKGIPPEKKPDAVKFFAIRKMDKARSKIVFSRNVSTLSLIQAAEEWQTGCANIPKIDSSRLITPFPLEIADLINAIWKENGDLANQGKAKVKSVKYYQGVELLLELEPGNEIPHFLRRVLRNSSGLIKYFGGQQHKRDGATTGKSEKIGTLLPVYGLLLRKSGFAKEGYVDSPAFLLGQVLKISDELHAMYCKVVREGSIPPQLVGNSIFTAAIETPYRALSLLATRMQPYIAWAKQYRTKTDNKEKGLENWRSGWYLNLYEETANKLHLVLSEKLRFNDFEKAQFFIGYLASFPKKDKVVSDDASSTDVGHAIMKEDNHDE